MSCKIFKAKNMSQLQDRVHVHNEFLKGVNVMKKLHRMLIALVCLFGATQAHASVIHIVDNGQLIRAENVSIDGRLFDISFVDGSCEGLFGGCD